MLIEKTVDAVTSAVLKNVCVALSLKVAIAVNLTDCPERIVDACGVMAIETSVSYQIIGPAASAASGRSASRPNEAVAPLHRA